MRGSSFIDPPYADYRAAAVFLRLFFQRAELRRRDDQERHASALLSEREELAILGDEIVRFGGERRFEELLVVRITAHGQRPRRRGQRIDASCDAPALRDARHLRLRIERALGEAAR